MSDDIVEGPSSRRRSVSIDRLYLDPNNFRFADHPDYQEVPPDRVFNANVQRRTNGLVLGRNQENVHDLIASIKANGWLEIDPILVDAKDKGRFLVVEGNRRVATLKYLHRRYQEDAIDLGKLDTDTFSKLPVVLYQGTGEKDYLVMMGLHHISGKRRWPAINRARAMKSLLNQFDGDADAVCDALGVTKREFNLSVRALALVDMYKESDYGDQLRSEQFNLFREVLANEAMRTWLGWNHEDLAAAAEPNLNRLFSWLSQEPHIGDEVEEGQDVDIESTSDPVITTVSQVRELAKIIKDPEAVQRLDLTRSLQEATLSSDLLVKSEIDDAFKSCDRGIGKLSSRISILASDELDRVEQLIGKLQGVMLARKRQPPTTGPRLPWQPFNEITQTRFSSLHVCGYRGINELVLDGLGRINLIVGVNNAGKTSLLEAIYLLAHLNDERALIDTIHWRARIDGDLPPIWLDKQLPRVAEISGRFDQVADNAVSVKFSRCADPDSGIGDQTSFLSKLTIESSYEQHTQDTEVAFFGDRPRRTRFNGQHWLCRSAFTSPFSANRPDTLERCFSESVQAGTKQYVIDFIREYVDPGVRNIEMADRDSRFVVTHDKFPRAPDLSEFGDGVRRIFEIGLLCAGVRGGVLLVDEFENAIHTGILKDFTRLLQVLAHKLNVQVFLSTHSKEAIDAFVLNGYETEDIVAYAINRSDECVNAVRFDGNRMKSLHEAIDFDLRGIR